MAKLLNGPEWGGHRRGTRVDMAGRLDPLTLATYRWRVLSNAYDSREVLDALANRLAAEAIGSERFGNIEWMGPGR